MARFHLLHFQTLPDRYRLQPSPLTSSTSSTTDDKGCANQTVASGSAALTALSCALTSQAVSSKFYHTTASSADGGPSFLGLFKCHGDLSASDCFSPAATPFTMYTVSSFPHDPVTQLLYKTIGSRSSASGGSNLEARPSTSSRAAWRAGVLRHQLRIRLHSGTVRGQPFRQ
ncbi:plasmodesmata-located protein 3-like [Zingiber officinale]|uniref:Uncharacterized protein n=1 Tax=Zingiber officinale TaxID=94328 RepID=A0A8J5L1F9_ZINOF|nr:plasmodesmata-located protein 3-like [Zingiber officinale]KAG6507394.1 hypothetical protein ZIOFF_032737 [Zingiber officinale]